MLTGYHGTTAARAESILKNTAFRSSVGDRHWLGDGVYFFSEELHAFIWNRDHCRSRHGCTDVGFLLKSYAIVVAEIRDDRVFDLDTAEHKLLFDETYRGVCDRLRAAKGSERRSCAEAVVLNLMFGRMRFCDSYDLVVATFVVRANRYDKSSLRVRLRGIPQKQICVKNTKVIGKIRLDDVENRVKDLEKRALALESEPFRRYSGRRDVRYHT